MIRFRSILVYVFTLLNCLNSSDGITRPSAIVLENNEFKHILLAINDDVPESDTLVQTIKDTFTKASSFLYEATEQRAVFRDVTILVPNTWSNKGYASATSQALKDADIIITTPFSPAPPPGVRRRRQAGGQFPPGQSPPLYRPPAQTKAYAGCGHPGVRILLDTNVLTDRRTQSQQGPPEKVLVHEWAHYRWGVFDEYALDGEPQFYFSPTTGQIEGIRCTEIIQGILRRTDPATNRPVYCRELDPSTGLYPSGCKFLPYPAGPMVTGVEASIMGPVNIRPISKFCNDDASNNATRHNYDAPSRHNRLCGHRSTWDVISSSEDFTQGKNAARAGLDPAPSFTVVQAGTTRRLVLALDTSSSMKTDNKLMRMKQAVSTFVQEGLSPDISVGLTTFSDKSHLRRAPMPLNTTQQKRAFAHDIPDVENGATDITLALTSAAEMLKSQDATPSAVQFSTSYPSIADSNSTLTFSPREKTQSPPSSKAMGGHVIVVTDGRATSGSGVSSALPSLRAAGAAVSFVILGGRPDPALTHLAHSTGGRIYCDSNLRSSTAATDAFFNMVQNIEPKNAPVQIMSRAEALVTNAAIKGTFSIDEQLGNATSILLGYEMVVPLVSVTSPTGRVYSHIYPEYSLDSSLNTATIRIPGTAEHGKWKYTVTNPGAYQRVSLLVVSSPLSARDPPVHVTATLIPRKNAAPPALHVFCEVTRAGSPVKGMHVVASVIRPDGAEENLLLLDNGAGADIVEGDGVYSRFYSHLQVPGLYTVRVDVTGHARHNLDTGKPSNEDAFVQRSVSAGYVVMNATNGTHAARTADVEAPARIADLKVVKTWSKNRTVILSWRASGDDTDRDTASSYEVYVAPRAVDLLRRTGRVVRVSQADVLHGSLASPRAFGLREVYVLQVPAIMRQATSFVFTVLAVDEAGNKGEHSNYVTVGLGVGISDITDAQYWQNAQPLREATVKLAAPQDQRRVIAGVLGFTSALMVAVLIGTAIVAVVFRRRENPVPALPFNVGHVMDAKKGSLRNQGKQNVFALS